MNHHQIDLPYIGGMKSYRVIITPNYAVRPQSELKRIHARKRKKLIGSGEADVKVAGWTVIIQDDLYLDGTTDAVIKATSDCYSCGLVRKDDMLILTDIVVDKEDEINDVVIHNEKQLKDMLPKLVSNIAYALETR